MGKVTCVVDVHEVRMVRFRRCAPVSQIQTLSRRTIDRNHKWCVYPLLVYFDYGWAFQVIIFALTASVWNQRYVLSYGQVRLPPRSVYSRISIESPPI